LAVVNTEQPAVQESGKPIVVCVDDDLSSLRAIARVLAPRCMVLVANNGLQALEHIKNYPDVACVLADLRMPGLPGAQLLARVAELRPLCRRAVVTGHPESEDLIKAINDGHLHYVITKPWKLSDLLQVVEQLVHTYRLERDNARLMNELRLANQHLRDHEHVLVAQLESRGREISAATEQLAQMGVQLDALTLRDGLTGLYTHRAFQERLREECALVGAAVVGGDTVAADRVVVSVTALGDVERHRMDGRLDAAGPGVAEILPQPVDADGDMVGL